MARTKTVLRCKACKMLLQTFAEKLDTTQRHDCAQHGELEILGYLRPGEKYDEVQPGWTARP